MIWGVGKANTGFGVVGWHVGEQLLELASTMLKLEGGQQRLESLTKSRIAALTKRSSRARREQGAGAAEGAALRASGVDDDSSPAAVEAAVMPGGAGAGGNGTDGSGLLGVGGAAAEAAALGASSDFMSIFELDDDDDDDDAGGWAMVQDGDDEGVLPFDAAAAPGSAGTAKDAAVARAGVLEEEGASEGGQQETFVELTRRVLGELDAANVTGSGTLELAQLRRNFNKFDTGVGAGGSGRNGSSGDGDASALDDTLAPRRRGGSAESIAGDGGGNVGPGGGAAGRRGGAAPRAAP
jgi:hypothetical protein